MREEEDITKKRMGTEPYMGERWGEWRGNKKRGAENVTWNGLKFTGARGGNGSKRKVLGAG